MKKQLLPDNVFELLFGVGAGVVIIGALVGGSAGYYGGKIML